MRRRNIDRYSADSLSHYRPTIDRPSTDYRPTIDRPSTDCRPTIDRLSTAISTAMSTDISVDITYSKQDPPRVDAGNVWYTHQTLSVLLALSVSSRMYFFCRRNLLYIFPLYYLTSEKCGFRGRKLFTVSRM